MVRGGTTYILTNKNHTVLYVGVSSDLIGRMYKHKNKVYETSFTRKYNVDKLVWYEVFHSIEEAIDREKQLKGGSRQKKLDLINAMNPNWNDLTNQIE
ncbi:MAG: GIY-YIG nuclease family protein [Mangrovibacterium sp.]